MTKRAKREYFQAIVRRYHRSGKRGKGEILNEFCLVCGHRSYAIRLLNRGYKRNKKRPGKTSKYQEPELLKILTVLWKGTGWVCGRLLKRAIPTWIPMHEAVYGEIPEELKSKLLTISASTIDRILRHARAKAGRGKSLTKPGSILREEIQTRGHAP